ncbi:hypothetical protein WKI45_04950 [Delftia tsuruhatensis]
MNSALLFLAVISFSAVAVGIFEKFSKAKILKNKKPENIKEVYERFSMIRYIDYEDYVTVLIILEKSFDIDCDLIRPYDRLQEFYDLDSWRMGEGVDMLNEELHNLYGICNIDGVKDIKELMRCVGERKRSQVD